MRVRVIGVGKIKENYLKKAIKYYESKLQHLVDFELIQVPDEKAPENLSEAQKIKIKDKEAEAILRRIGPLDRVVTLEIQGQELGTAGIKDLYEAWKREGAQGIVFVIGGSLGLSELVTRRSNVALSFSKMTFPHQLMRVVLMDQLEHIICDKLDC